MCAYGGQGQKKTVDVFWKEGAKVPDTMCSEIAKAINKGIIEVRNQTSLKTIFEASIVISNIPIGTTLETFKKFLSNFKNEFYTERNSKTQF